MTSSIEETTIITPEDELAAHILIQLSRDSWNRPREEDAIADEAEVPPTLVLQQVSEAPKQPSKRSKCNEIQSKKIRKQPRKRKRVAEEDDSEALTTKKSDNSEETLMLMHEWNQAELDPLEIFPGVAEQFSEPIKKQLTKSDVEDNQSRLMLGMLKVQQRMLPLLEASEDPYEEDGIDVKVYGPNGVVQKMKFKIWNNKTPVLTTGWKEFVAKCGLKMHCDFIAVWMFRHMRTRKICFAIGCSRFPSIQKPLSTRIVREVFSNQN
ncbi:unnamed protein product [Microthlaspi erraticum]|uniref:TF-B3 domain-containing protein n=1 Tax=Microthlaspi erraticum TaxID=1685480 RepID=A0A6D2ITS0_9BRAS|nr:unnamed protein product [Microthlaspi erraticum]